MKIVKFLGGLGNQMFQYAFYKALKSKFKNVKADLTGYNNYDLHNGFELEDIFDIQLERACTFTIKLYNSENRDWHIRKLRRILDLKNTYEEEKNLFTFDPYIFTDKHSRFYWGYWQNEQYFKEIRDQIIKDFHFKKDLNDENLYLLRKINQSESISLHVRRGDYLKDELLGGVCGIEYYQNAIKVINEKIDNASFFIFSDDIEWCKKNLKTIRPTTFISHNKGISSYIDMQLMSNCKHNIIANSSFSWWGAWLNQHQNKVVIAPKKWTSNPVHQNGAISLKDWITL